MAKHLRHTESMTTIREGENRHAESEPTTGNESAKGAVSP